MADIVYSAVGPEVTVFALDVRDASLNRRSTVTLPTDVQEAWPHPSAGYLYVVSSDGGPTGRPPGATHLASAFRIDARSGALTPHGEPRALPSRPIHCSVDVRGEFLLSAFNHPSAVTVHRIEPDGTLGEPVAQPDRLDCGVYGHYVRTTPSNRTVLLVARGNDAAPGKPEDPGAIKVLRFDNGVLENVGSIAPGGGFGFRPRHLDFHPRHPWVYVAVESQNELHMYGLRPDGSLEPEPSFVTTTLADARDVCVGQVAGAIRVHPSGRWIYVTNRNSEVVAVEGVMVSRGGENNVAVFAIDATTGEPTLLGHSESDSIHFRTFSVHSNGRLAIAASISPMAVRGGATLPARLTLYRIGVDGMLELAHSYDVDTGRSMQLWSGIVEPPT